MTRSSLRWWSKRPEQSQQICLRSWQSSVRT